jgi:hypothetical protein
MTGTKTGGRVKGTPNKVTSQLRDTLKAAIGFELDRLTETLAELPAKDRLELLIRLMPFVLPKVDLIGASYDNSWADFG